MSKRKKMSREQQREWLRNFTDSVSYWVGSWSFFAFHIIWFAVWLIFSWDISLLTMIVSLEAIILMLLLLMQQNRQVERDDIRDEADYRIDRQTKNVAEQNKKILMELKKQTDRLEKLLKRHDKTIH